MPTDSEPPTGRFRAIVPALKHTKATDPQVVMALADNVPALALKQGVRVTGPAEYLGEIGVDSPDFDFVAAGGLDRAAMTAFVFEFDAEPLGASGG